MMASGRIRERLARWRVRLGFLVAVVALGVAQPSWASWRIGLAVALLGEGVRVWAAGHLEKGREVTRSGPYRWSRHPLYIGSTLIGLGIVIASRHAGLAILAAVYFAATIAAAVRTEDAELRRVFGSEYDAYLDAGPQPASRRFSAARAVRNREYRAVIGLAAGFALLALRAGGLL
ncbi:MAG: isoprenylcysteine carboxylmethyltransferase family protein [Acidimicrobiia bacterium]|nr:isoprenylcysteine carboxylmethyltransferase family protein [Acidimicrobiia bacterium]